VRFLRLAQDGHRRLNPAQDQRQGCASWRWYGRSVMARILNGTILIALPSSGKKLRQACDRIMPGPDPADMGDGHRITVWSHWQLSWEDRMNKAASVVSLLLLWVFAAGCGSQSTKARVHLSVFEVPTQVLRLHTSDQNPRKLPQSDYYVSVVTPNDLNAMLRSQEAQSRVLADSTRVINDWPAIADTWVYSPSYAGLGPDGFYTGGGAGSLGVRERGGRLEVRLDYLVDHRGPAGKKLIESKIFYEHLYPEGEVLLFHTPSAAANGVSRQHVIAFEITRDQDLPKLGEWDRPSRTPDVLGYR
jgi:hypothetical protein